MNIQKTLDRFRKLGYVIVNHDYYESSLTVYLKFQTKKTLLDIPKSFYKNNGYRITVDWDAESVKDWLSQKISKDNITIYCTAFGDLHISDRNYYRTYLLDKRSRKYPPKYDRERTNGHGPRLWLHAYHTLRFIRDKAARVIQQHHLKKFMLIVEQGPMNTFGGYIGVGEYNYWKKIWDPIQQRNKKYSMAHQKT